MCFGPKRKRNSEDEINHWPSNVLHLKQKWENKIPTDPQIEVQFIVRMPYIWYP